MTKTANYNNKSTPLMIRFPLFLTADLNEAIFLTGINRSEFVRQAIATAITSTLSSKHT